MTKEIIEFEEIVTKWLKDYEEFWNAIFDQLNKIAKKTFIDDEN